MVNVNRLPKKKDDQVNIDIDIVYGTIYALQRKYLGVLLDETMFFKHHVSYMCRRITRNNGIIKSKLRRYLILPQVKQIYYIAQYTHIFSMQY